MFSVKKVTVLTPHYMKKFRCIGSACPEACCTGWKIFVDAGPMACYRKLEKTELSDLLEKSIENLSIPEAKGFPGRIILRENGRCPFLDDSNLCRIHRVLGEEYLPSVCATYPRIANKLAETYERSAFISCPEVARIALLDPGPMEFDQDDEDCVGRDLVKYTLSEDAADRLWTVRQFIFPLLQNRTLKVWERLILLGLFCRKISNDEVQVQSVVDEYEEVILDPETRKEFSRIPLNISLQLRLLTEIVFLRNSVEATSPTYSDCYQSFLRGLQYTPSMEPAELEKSYQHAYVTWYQPVMGALEHIFENYLVNLAFRGVFPYTDGKPVFDNYIKFVLQYSLLKVLLVGIAADEGGLSENSTVKLIFSFAKTIEHHEIFLDAILEKLRQQGMDGMPFMAILLKNHSS